MHRYMLIETCGVGPGEPARSNGVSRVRAFDTLDAMKEAAESVFCDWERYWTGKRLEPGDCLDEDGQACESLKWAAAHRSEEGCDGWFVHAEAWERLESLEWNGSNGCYDKRMM